MTKQKFYVVWKGRKPGIYTTWPEAEGQVRGIAGAQYKAFGTRPEAETAFRSTYDAYKGKSSSLGKWRHAGIQPILPSICVDAACNGSPGILEFRAVFTETGDQIFHFGPYPDGTNNVGEFLAIVHALTWMQKHRSPLPVYSDSENGISWVYQGKCKTNLKHTLRNAPLFAMIDATESWLAENELKNGTVLKWDTERWGEIPADFGRK
ncbi:MAG: viroplasmin family protein [Bacteroidota bacterium]